MKKFVAIVFLLSFAAMNAFAQWGDKAIYATSTKYAPKKMSDKVKFVEWADSPRIHPVPPEFAEEPAIYLLRDVDVDYRFEGKSTNCFRTFHQIVKVLDKRGIERFNTVKLPVGFSTRVPLVRARTITQSGKIYEVAKDRIQVTKDPSGYYTIVVAMEGVEVNSELELLMKTITPYSFYGSSYFQSDIPIEQAHFTLTYPNEFLFEMKSHNGFPELRDSSSKKRKFFEVYLSNIPAVKSEPHSFYDLHRMSIEYRMMNWEGNTERPRLNTWDDFARRLWNNNYNLSEKEKGAVNRYLSELGVRANGNELENIRKIEKGIKTGIALYQMVNYDQRKEVLASRDFRSISTYSAYYDDKKDVLDSIISKRAATESGYVKLFAACLTQAGIRHQLGTTGERSEYVFDKNFENWATMDHTLFYFPNLKKYLSPTDLYLRFPMIPSELTGGKGVFCNIPPSGVPTGTVFEFRTITGLPASESRADMSASVNFTKDMDAQVELSYSYKGYLSTDLRTRLAFTRPERVKELVQDMIPFLDKPENLQKYTISNEGFSNYVNNKPLEIYASLTTTSLVEKAGVNYLVKVGSIIGKQEELYSETERKLPVDLYFPNTQNRTITISIPKGYKVLNPEVLQLSNEYLNGDLDAVIGFKSDYTIIKDKVNGDKLVITITESYSQLHFSTYDYPRYRKVVNTAADFNNVAILIGKKPV